MIGYIDNRVTLYVKLLNSFFSKASDMTAWSTILVSLLS